MSLFSAEIAELEGRVAALKEEVAELRSALGAMQIANVWYRDLAERISKLEVLYQNAARGAWTVVVPVAGQGGQVIP